MSFSKCFRFASVAASFALALALVPRTASAQQVTYYDFDEPQSTPGQVNTQCTASTVGSSLFCFNDVFQNGLSPSFLSDTFPAIIDPNNADNPPVQSTHYAVLMTPAAQTQGSSQWFAVPQKVASGFTTYFTFKFTPNANSYATADGIAFVIQNSLGGGASAVCAATGAGPGIVGGNGGCIGYGGIDNSLAVEFDTYRNDWDPQDILSSQYNDNHVAIQNCGAGLPNSPDHTGSCLVQLNAATSPLPAITSQLNGITLADGNLHQIVIIYSGPTEATPNLLQVFIDPPFNPGTHTPSALAVPVLSGTYNLAANLNLQNSAATGAPASLDSAYVGFTSATGAAFEQHEIFNWTFTPHTTVTQVQPIAQGGAPTVAPFGSYVEASTFPADVPTSSVSQVFTSNPISPQLFAQLIANTPFAGSQCQIYDNTGGNCVSVSRYCVTTGTTTVVPCPPPSSNEFVTIKSAYDDSIPATSPGYLQGDPFYDLIGTITGDGNTATVVCPGECDVTTGQTITIVGAQTNGNPSPFNGTAAVLAADPINSPSTFTFLSSVAGSATGGYLSSSNVQNVFSSYSPLRIDATTTGKVNHFSDFIVTAITASQVTLNLAPPTGVTYGQPAVIPVTVSSVNGSPTGSVLLSVDGGSPIPQPLTPGTSSSTASFTLTGLTAGTHSLSVTYPTSGYWLTNTATASLVIGQTGSSITIKSDTPNPSAVSAPVTLGFSVSGTGTPTGAYTVTSSTAGDPSCSSTLTAGAGTCLLTFTTPGVRTLTITYAGDANFTGSLITVQQTVNGPIATLSTSSLNFGTVYLGNIGLQSVTLTNTGSYKMTVNTPFLFDVGNGDSQNFIALNLCPSTLAVGKSCTIYVGFIAGPTYNAPQTAILKVMDNAPGNPQQVSLTANVIDPVASFSPSPLSFGTDPVGTTVKSTITLKNTGGTTLTLGAFSLKGTNASDFNVAPNCPASLAPSASCSLSVSFTPGKTGARSAYIWVNNNTQSGSSQVNLTGTGK